MVASKKINVSHILFEIGFLLIGISKLWRFHDGNDTVFLVMGLLLLLLKILIDRTYDKYQVICFAVVFFIGMIILIKTGELNVFSLFIVAFSMKGIEIEKILKQFVILHFLFFAGTIVLCKMGVIYDDIYYFSRPGQVLARHSYGLGHPNQVFMRLLLICTIILTCFREKYHKMTMILILVISTAFYKGTDSRSGFLCIILLLITVGVLDVSRGKIKQMFSGAMFALYFLLVLLPIIFLFVNGSLIQVIDNLITGRISLGKSFLDAYSLSMFGVNKIITSKYVIDNSYMYILIHYGILFYVLYAVAIGGVLWKLYKEKRVYEMDAIIILHIYAFVECVLINPIFNFGILFIGRSLMNPISISKER